MSQEPSLAQRSANTDRMAWLAYWQECGQYWRTEPEIDEDRQRHLTQRRAINPDIANKIYPFKDGTLNRADVEWLLSTHENRGLIGPVDWIDPKQLEREGLDLRGDDLRGTNLESLPLSGLQGGLHGLEQICKRLSGQAAVAASQGHSDRWPSDTAYGTLLLSKQSRVL